MEVIAKRSRRSEIKAQRKAAAKAYRSPNWSYTLRGPSCADMYRKDIKFYREFLLSESNERLRKMWFRAYNRSKHGYRNSIMKYKADTWRKVLPLP
ncbi:hypothetical protein UFOVP142_67 [uncultured Caudovirales phage]|uniref:Uncharacterized protein n=1 Tax=uncultured Caudovirales phage TaxID=2100421 RepID=A0A6J7XJV9_9CAUD|nr:hypothetical protein UFOVP142_67 [uncultured Caudovirales phage]